MSATPPASSGGDKKKSSPPRFPQRDDKGAIVLLTEMLAYTLLVIAVGVAMLVAIDGLFALLGFGVFGQISGWISGILAVFVFVDDFRAHKDKPVRWLVAGAALALSVVVGLGILTQLPPFWMALFNGAISVTVASMLYAVAWFTGIRLLRSDKS